MKPLAEILNYKNALVIARFNNRFPELKSQSEQIFKDMLSFLWLSSTHQKLKQENPKDPNYDFSAVMHTEMFHIDEMWHDFILMTKDYSSFCQDYFGYFQHHQVNERAQLPDEKKLLIESRRFFSFIYDQLGEATLCRWMAHS